MIHMNDITIPKGKGGKSLWYYEMRETSQKQPVYIVDRFHIFKALQKKNELLFLFHEKEIY